MENKQINFFKSKDFNTVLKPFKKGTVVKIDNLELREKEKIKLTVPCKIMYLLTCYFV